MTRCEQALRALEAKIRAALPGVDVNRNGVLPEALPRGGWVNLLDGELGDCEETIGVRSWYFPAHRVDVDLTVQQPDDAVRTAAVLALIEPITNALVADPTLGGLVDDAQPRLQGVTHEEWVGAATTATARLTVLLSYEGTGPTG